MWEQGTIPRAGGVLLDSTYSKIVLVKGSGVYSYSLPKGKIETDEKEHEAAQREVFEEVGFNTGNLEGNKIGTVDCNNAKLYLFYVPDVPLDFDFQPTCNFEVDDVRFFEIDKIHSRGFYENGKIHFSKSVMVSLDVIKAYCHKQRTRHSLAN